MKAISPFALGATLYMPATRDDILDVVFGMKILSFAHSLCAWKMQWRRSTSKVHSQICRPYSWAFRPVAAARNKGRCSSSVLAMQRWQQC